MEDEMEDELDDEIEGEGEEESEEPEEDLAGTGIPDDCRYTREDEWVRNEGDHLVIGITDYAQDQLGDVVFVELPEVGSTVNQADTFGAIESVKAVSELYSPVTGEVLAINEDLADRPELVNEDCYGEGWLLKVRPSEPSELESLLVASEYAEYVAERAD